MKRGSGSEEVNMTKIQVYMRGDVITRPIILYTNKKNSLKKV